MTNNFKCHVETKGFLKVTGNDRSDNIMDMMQDTDDVTMYISISVIGTLIWLVERVICDDLE